MLFQQTLKRQTKLSMAKERMKYTVMLQLYWGFWKPTCACLKQDFFFTSTRQNRDSCNSEIFSCWLDVHKQFYLSCIKTGKNNSFHCLCSSTMLKRWKKVLPYQYLCVYLSNERFFFCKYFFTRSHLEVSDRLKKRTWLFILNLCVLNVKKWLVQCTRHFFRQK